MTEILEIPAVGGKKDQFGDLIEVTGQHRPK
jgi:hypothetical protein